MTTATTREVERLQRIIAAQEADLEHKAEMLSDCADRIVELERDLADAVALGSEFATALHWAVPDSPVLLRAQQRA